MNKAPQLAPNTPDGTTPGALHKTITLRYYLAGRTGLLAIKKEDVEWLNLESGEELVVHFHKGKGYK